MFRKYHNHTLQTNPQHLEEESQNTNSHKTPERQSKATSNLFLVKMIAKLERTLTNAYFAVDSVVKTQASLSLHRGFLTNAMCHRRETIKSN